MFKKSVFEEGHVLSAARTILNNSNHFILLKQLLQTLFQQ